MDYRREREVSDAISIIEWMKDEINMLESQVERLEDQVSTLESEVKDLQDELSHYDIRDRNDQ